MRKSTRQFNSRARRKVSDIQHRDKTARFRVHGRTPRPAKQQQKEYRGHTSWALFNHIARVRRTGSDFAEKWTLLQQQQTWLLAEPF
jgi:hypothetical protein